MSIAPDFWLDKQWRKAGIKLRKHTFKNFNKFFLFQIGRTLNLFVFPVKSTMFSYVWIGMHVWATGERGWPRGWQTLTRAENLLMPHPPGLARCANAPQLPGGGRGGQGCTWNWLMRYLKTIFSDIVQALKLIFFATCIDTNYGF